MFGRRRVFLIGTVIFALFSLASGLAPDALTLIIFRGLMGIGGALMWPAILGLTFDLLPESQGRPGRRPRHRRRGARERHRAAGRRGVDPGPQLALDLLRQPPDRRARRRGHLVDDPARQSGGARSAPRLRRRRHVERRADRAPARPRLLELVGVEQQPGSSSSSPSPWCSSLAFVFLQTPRQGQRPPAAGRPAQPRLPRRLRVCPVHLARLLRRVALRAPDHDQGASATTRSSRPGPAPHDGRPTRSVSLVAGPLYSRIGARIAVSGGAACITVGMVVLALLPAHPDLPVPAAGPADPRRRHRLLLFVGDDGGRHLTQSERASLAGGLVYMCQVAGAPSASAISTAIVAAAPNDSFDFVGGVTDAFTFDVVVALVATVIAFVGLGRRFATARLARPPRPEPAERLRRPGSGEAGRARRP